MVAARRKALATGPRPAGTRGERTNAPSQSNAPATLVSPQPSSSSDSTAGATRIEIPHGATRGRRLARDRIRLPPAPRFPSVRACEHDTPRPCKHDGQNGDDHPAKLVPTGDHCKHLITTWADDATTGRSERPLSYANSPHSVQSKIESGQLSPAPPIGRGVQTMFDPGSQGGYDNVD